MALLMAINMTVNRTINRCNQHPLMALPIQNITVTTSGLSSEDKDRALFALFALLLTQETNVPKSTGPLDHANRDGKVDVQRRDDHSANS